MQWEVNIQRLLSTELIKILIYTLHEQATRILNNLLSEHLNICLRHCIKKSRDDKKTAPRSIQEVSITY